MLSNKDGFVRLPKEHIIYTSPPRTALALKPPASWQEKETFSVSSSSGCLYLTNQRVRHPRSGGQENNDSLTIVASFQDCLSAHPAYCELAIIHSAAFKPSRQPRLGSFLWSERMDGFGTARCWRRIPAVASIGRTENHVQRRGCLRFPFKF